MKKWFNEYFRFTRKERVGVLVLVALIIAFLLMPQYYHAVYDPVKPDSALLKLFQVPVQSNAIDREGGRDILVTNTHYFYFDPNIISEKEWQALGLRQKTIQTIFNYRIKGGKFKVAEDLRKIWGLPKATADRLIPFIRISKPKRAEPEPYPHYSKLKPGSKVSIQSLPTIDVNTATIAEWEMLPGIGAILAARIVKFREKLGGFTSIEQVRSTYGIKDSVFQILLPLLTLNSLETKNATIKLSINFATAKALKERGISSDIAYAIVNYRNQYGLFKELSDLKKIAFISETIYNQIIPILQL